MEALKSLDKKTTKKPIEEDDTKEHKPRFTPVRESLSATVVLRMSIAMREVLEEEAVREGMDISDLVRGCLELQFHVPLQEKGHFNRRKLDVTTGEIVEDVEDVEDDKLSPKFNGNNGPDL